MAEYDVILLPSFAQVESWLKGRADERAQGAFAQAVTTFDEWVADLWELHGDGRALVSAVQRQVLMRCAMGPCAEGVDLRGMVKLGAACMRECAGVPQLEEAIAAARCGGAVDGLSEGEIDFLEALARYEDLLGSLGLVEAGQAAMLLSERADSVFAPGTRVLVAQAPPMAERATRFFEACTPLEVTVQLADGGDGVERAPEGVDVRFAFPSGRLAQAGLVADVVCERASAGDAVVACKDPLALFAQAGDRLAEAGLSVRAQGSKPFARTDFGRAYLGMCHCLHDNPWEVAVLSDVVSTPFSGFSRGDALRIDASLRADRIATLDDVLADLRLESEPFSQLEELANDPDADVLVGVFEQMVQASARRSPAWKAEQLAALRMLREVTGAARRAGAGIDVCMDVLADAAVQVSVQVGGSSSAVTMLAQERAAALRPGSCATLVMADLTSEDYPVARKDDAAATLLGKLGIDRGEGALQRARRQFNALLGLPSECVCLVRPLGDDNADATYPCAMLEEFVDTYRADPSATDDIDNPFRLPPQLQAGLVERGEELLFANACAAVPDAVQAMGAHVPQPSLGDLADTPSDRVLPPRRTADGQALERPCPSPSQIEVYLECPLHWFAERRLRMSELEEGFGPLERGTFAHAALERFYREFQREGHDKVSAGNIDEARAVMRQVLEGLRAQQPSEEPLSGRLVPLTELERRDVDALCRQLEGYLDFEAQLLPTFHPAYLEYEIDADHAVEYAGFSLVGKVDRIDVDDAGRAVIVDYKGSVKSEHEIGGKTREHPGKVQALVYAQAVKRALGLDVVGALYVSYGRRPSIAGAYDPRVLETPHLPNMRHAKCSCSLGTDKPEGEEGELVLASLPFDELLDEVERLAGEAIASMAAGDVAPRPAHAGACQYCPILFCEGRQ